MEKVDAEVIATWERMLKAMYAMPGVGLAAPQIGVSRRIIVVDCDRAAPARRPAQRLVGFCIRKTCRRGREGQRLLGSLRSISNEISGFA